ncbi:hypothetical protein LJR235_003787 [Pararhizobium sp. LjRoot235]|uniref:hypothetical protein n=1 Tax=Pararhizobium sp. LjRoot235 TaxID=3342291 RepID=UPI003ECD0604
MYFVISNLSWVDDAQHQEKLNRASPPTADDVYARGVPVAGVGRSRGVTGEIRRSSGSGKPVSSGRAKSLAKLAFSGRLWKVFAGSVARFRQKPQALRKIYAKLATIWRACKRLKFVAKVL